MPTWGNCALVPSAMATATGYATRLRTSKRNLPVAGLVDKMRVRLQVPKYPLGDGDYPFKCIIYNDNGNYPDVLQGVSGIETLPDESSKEWVEFTFSPALNLPAGDYWIGVVRGRNKGNFCDVQTTGLPWIDIFESGQDWYNNPPNPHPAGGNVVSYLIWCCGDYTVVANPYPTARLKKGFISGYHCFISAYISAEIGGYDPLKLPDGTVF